MATPDLLIGFVLSKLFEKKNGAAARPADIHVPPAPTAPPFVPPAPPPLPPGPEATQPTVTPPPPTFPVNVVVPPAPPPVPVAPPGMKKAVEVWQVKPEIAAAAAGMLAGAGPQVAALSLSALEQNFPSGWSPAQVVTATEVQTAKAMLAQWRDGGVIFLGPGNLAQRRAYRMTKHGQATPAPQPQPVQPAAPPPPPGPTVPASVVTPAAAPPPAAAAPAPVAVPPPAAAPPTSQEAPQRPAGLRQIGTIRRGEGLLNMAKRLGRTPDGATLRELQAENVPQGPENVQWSTVPAAKGGIKKLGRVPGTQPGDRFFLPMAWGFIDPARL